MKKLYFGGPVLTMERTSPRAEALLTEGGTILAVGKLSDLEALAGNAERVCLHGRTLCPGFVDGHSHLCGEGLFSFQCDLTDCTGFDDLLRRIRVFREKRELIHAEAIVCRGYDPECMAEHAHPDAGVLDTLGFDNPVVCVHQSGHVVTANTAAMRSCGLDDSFAAPSGGFAGRSADGHLTGYFEESAAAPLAPLRKNTPEQAEEGILLAQEEYIRHGFTTVQDGSANAPGRLALFERLNRRGALRTDVVVYLKALADDEAWACAFTQYGNREPHGRLTLGGVKLFLDGSPQARTAWMLEPYAGETEYRGYPKLSDGTVEKTVLRAARQGVQMLAHCNGDAAAEQYLRAWEKAVQEVPEAKNLRSVMVHAQTVQDSQLARMAPLGMMPSFFVGHCWYWGDTHLRNFGPERGRRISPVDRALALDLPCSFHQDCPVTRPDMLHSVWCAVNRITKNGVSIGPEHRISAYDAMICATRGGAYTYFSENRRGVLRPGAAADLVLLSSDPTAVDPMAIRDIQVLATVKDGETLFEA